MHEIITLQLGQRSNYLGTHFWNTQESYFTYSGDEESPIDHDVHFRPGIGADGSETFMPRTVIYDLKGGFGSLRKINALYELEEEQRGIPRGLWDGNTVVQRQTTITQHEYQCSLDAGVEPPPLRSETIRYWSDFNRVFYHPKSIVQLNDYEPNSSLMPFERWDLGEELFANLDKEHDLLDRDLRPFMEECDQIQGLQIMTGVDDAWGGFAARYMDRLRDEYGKTGIWTWALEDGKKGNREQQLMKAVNTAKSYQEISTQASLYIPVVTPPEILPYYVNLSRASTWHTSALIATAIESMTLPSRLKPVDGQRETLDQLEVALNINGDQKIAKLEFSVLDPNTLDREYEKTRSGQQSDLRNGQQSAYDQEHDGETAPAADLRSSDMDLFPLGKSRRLRTPHTFGQVEAVRGDHADTAAVGPTEGSDDGAARARMRAAGQPITKRYYSQLSFPILSSFPPMYTTYMRDDRVAVSSTLSTTSSVSDGLQSLGGLVGRLVGLDEREVLMNSLGELSEAYREGWESGSDEEDD